MIIFPNAKINLGLQILGKRSDGFHELETIFYPIQFSDVLEIIPARNARTEIEFHTSGNGIDIPEEDNLCIKAYRLLKSKFPDLPSVIIHLHKAIPTEAGLGGGSSDAASTLILLNKMFSLGLESPDLLHLSSQLGSDCPFFIINKPCLGKGRGEILEPVDLDLSGFKIIIANPGIRVSTRWVFSNYKPVNGERKRISELIKKYEIPGLFTHLYNDLEEPVFKEFPDIKKIKDTFYENGAHFASMSGSGSSVYGIFRKDQYVPADLLPPYIIKELTG